MFIDLPLYMSSELSDILDNEEISSLDTQISKINPDQICYLTPLEQNGTKYTEIGLANNSFATPTSIIEIESKIAQLNLSNIIG